MSEFLFLPREMLSFKNSAIVGSLPTRELFPEKSGSTLLVVVTSIANQKIFEHTTWRESLGNGNQLLRREGWFYDGSY